MLHVETPESPANTSSRLSFLLSHARYPAHSWEINSLTHRHKYISLLERPVKQAN